MGEFRTSGRWMLFFALSLAYFLLNLSTFASLGVVLYTMVADLHWSQTEAGFSFSVLGIACGLSSPLPALTMKRWGGRTTVCLGMAFLCAGFLLAALAEGLWSFYVAMVLLGLGFSQAGNIPGVELIAAWFEKGASRLIGLYLMLGALGGAFGPPLVDMIVRNSGGWRGHWQAMAAASFVVGVVCLIFVRDAPLKARPADAAPPTAADWTVGQAQSTRQFALVALVMTVTMAALTTLSSVGVPHLVKLGATQEQAALALSAIYMSGTLIKGVAGRLCEKIASAVVLAAGMVLQVVGIVVLAFANAAPLWYGGALIFGTGWGLVYVAGTLVLLDYFGAAVGSRILATVWLLTTIAAAGPFLAGMVADRYDSFVPILLLFGGLLFIVVPPILMMRAPVRKS